MEFKRAFSGTPWENRVGYCRALKAGDDGQTFAPGDAYLQACKCFEIMQAALAKLDVPMSRVVRTRMFVTDITKWEEVGKAHEEFFREYPPATSMIEVKGLIDPEMLIEIEADAFVGKG